MRKMNRGMVMVLALSLALAGCGSKEKEAAELMSKASEAMATVTSLQGQMNMDVSLTMGEESVTTLTKAEISSIVSPMKMKLEVSSNGANGGEATKLMDMYVLEDGDNVTSYVDMGTGWLASTAGVESIGHYNAYDSMNQFLLVAENGVIVGEETIGGVATTRVDGVITGDAMKSVVNESGALGTLERMGVTQEDIDVMYEKVESIPISLWIGEDGYVYQYQADLAKAMKLVMDMTMVMMGMDPADQTKAVVVDNATIVMTCSQFNGVADFEIPAEALEAEPVK